VIVEVGLIMELFKSLLKKRKFNASAARTKRAGVPHLRIQSARNSAKSKSFISFCQSSGDGISFVKGFVLE
jgi:hypothetical protein